MFCVLIMSRIGALPIAIPDGVTVEINGQKVSVKGPKGQLERIVDSEIKASQKEKQIIVERAVKGKEAKQKWGLFRSLIFNMVAGVTEGFEKTLNIEGVGYRANVQSPFLNLNLGYSHEIKYHIPERIEIKCPKPTIVVLSSFDKEALGQAAAEIRAMRLPEPYKGKGIKYEGEYIFRKEGKK